MAVRDGTVPASFPTGMVLALALSVLALLTSLRVLGDAEGKFLFTALSRSAAYTRNAATYAVPRALHK